MRVSGLMRVSWLWLPPMAVIAATAFAVAATAPEGMFAADQVGDVEVLLDEILLDDVAGCNQVTGSTLCAGGTVRGSSGAPTSVPVYDSSCYLDVLVTARRGDTCAMH